MQEAVLTRVYHFVMHADLYPACGLQVYIESILALQHKACAEQGKAVMLELVIMTSDDTHSKTQALLDTNSHFGMKKTQLHLVKQEKVQQPHLLQLLLCCSCYAFLLGSCHGALLCYSLPATAVCVFSCCSTSAAADSCPWCCYCRQVHCKSRTAPHMRHCYSCLNVSLSV